MHRWLIACLLSLATWPTLAADLIDFWSIARYGGNSFNRTPPDRAYFNGLARQDASWVRLSYDRWPSTQRDFLLGNADHYQGLDPVDLAQLIQVLDHAHQAGLKVVIAPLSLPGMRWAHHNGDTVDDRLWRDARYGQQAVTFWRDLAQALHAHPAVAAYGLVNPLAPEDYAVLGTHAAVERYERYADAERPAFLNEFVVLSRIIGLAGYAKPSTLHNWYSTYRCGTRDLPAFHREITAAIREIDALTPVMLDVNWYPGLDALDDRPQWLPVNNSPMSVHLRESFAATHAANLLRSLPYADPKAAAAQKLSVDPARVALYMRHHVQWTVARGVPHERLVVGEFHCPRRVSGCALFLEDALQVLNRNQLHWTFYSVRQGAWEGRDPIGTDQVPWRSWRPTERGEPDPSPLRAVELFRPIAEPSPQ